MTRTGNNASEYPEAKAKAQTKQAEETHKVLNASRVNWRVNEFCIAHRISRAHFYREVKAGRLSYFKTGTLSLVPQSVAAEWQNARVAETTTQHAA
jgi:hypothetical protein